MNKKNDLLYLTVEDAAARLGVSIRTINRWRHDGMGPPYILIGKKKLGYREQDIIDYIDSSVFDPSAKKKG